MPPFQSKKLYYQTMPKTLIRIAVRLAPLLGMDPRHFGSNRDIDLVTVVAEGDFPTHARINCRSVAKIRDEATACHTSQLGGGGMSQRGPVAILPRLLGSTEMFCGRSPLQRRDCGRKIYSRGWKRFESFRVPAYHKLFLSPLCIFIYMLWSVFTRTKSRKTGLIGGLISIGRSRISKYWYSLCSLRLTSMNSL